MPIIESLNILPIKFIKSNLVIFKGRKISKYNSSDFGNLLFTNALQLLLNKIELNCVKIISVVLVLCVLQVNQTQ